MENKIDTVAVLREALKNLINLDQRSGWFSKEQDAAIAALAATDRASTVAKDTAGEAIDIDKMYAVRFDVYNSASAGDLLGAMRAIEQYVLVAYRGSGVAGMCRDVITAFATAPKLAATQQAGEWTEKLDRWWLNADGVSDTFVRLSDVERLFAKPIEKESTADDAGLRVIKFIEKLDKRLVAEGYALECRRAVVNAIMEIGQVAAPISEDTAKAECGACNGSGWVPRDADIGTEQECFSCDGSGLAEEEAPAAPGSIGNAQAVEIAARIFGFKPHKQTEEDKAMWIELSNAYVLADRAARAGKGSIGDDPKFDALLTTLTGWHITPNSVPGAIEKRIAAREAFITYVDNIIQGTRNEQ